MTNVEELKQKIVAHEQIIKKLQGEFVPVPSTLNIPHEYREECDYNVIDYFTELKDNELPGEAMSLRNEIVQRIESLNVILNEKHRIAVEHNNAIDKKIDEEYKRFKEAVVIPESALSSRMVIPCKEILKEERDAFRQAYKELGLTHYKSEVNRDFVYYNPEINHFNTLKSDFYHSLSLKLQKKFPKLVDQIHNQKLRTGLQSNSDVFDILVAERL